MRNKLKTSLMKVFNGGHRSTRLYKSGCHKPQRVSGISNNVTLYSQCIYQPKCYLTVAQASANVPNLVKWKQALLGSNLPGIASAEKSRNEGTRSSGRVPTHHFGPYLRKPKAINEQSFLSGHRSSLNTKKSVPDSAIVKFWHTYGTLNDRD